MTQLEKNACRFTKEELAQALIDVLDGNSSPGQIVYFTGLPKERAEKISEMFKTLIKD